METDLCGLKLSRILLGNMTLGLAGYLVEFGVKVDLFHVQALRRGWTRQRVF